ncbi:TetR/AcrR family transcriptional regulator [Sporomusa rhizae]|uniref:TetR/AcrR family transcriptional regulator n=1 Tax=Sporomusa rhizae TaxID=357999 RepID=UPI00352B5C70
MSRITIDNETKKYYDKHTDRKVGGIQRRADDSMTKENIITAALRLFLTRGYKSVSLIDVATEVGVTKGGIYHYFSSKDELLQVAFNFLIEHIETKYKKLLNSSTSLRDVLQAILVEDALATYVMELLGGNSADCTYHVHFTIEVMQLFPEISKRIRENQELLCEAIAVKIQQAVEKEEIREDTDVDAFAAIIIALLNGQGYQSVSMKQRMVDSIWSLIRV